MASYYQTRKTQTLSGGHICSKCKSVILTDFVFYAIANSRWTQKKAQEGADDAAELGLKALLSFPEKPFLVTQVSEDRSYSLVSGFGTEGLDHACPYCGNREQWQLGDYFAAACRMDPETGVSLVEDVPDESRLTVFTSKEALDAWRIQVLAKNTLKTTQHWEEHPAEAKNIRAQLHNLTSQMDALESQKKTVREKSQWLFEKMQSKEAEMKGYSLFSAERKGAKAELNDLKKQYNAQSAADLEQEKVLINNIQNLRKQINELKVSNPGILGEVETVTPDNAPHCRAIRLS